MRKDGMRRRIKELVLSKRFFVALMILMCLLALICIISVLFRFMRVGHFEIKGVTDYEISELVSASGIRRGDGMYTVNEKKATKKLLEGCPYLKDAKVSKKFPNKICFEVNDRPLGWYVQIGYDFYAIDYDMIVLLETQDEQSLIEKGLTKLVLPELESVVCGYIPSFGHGDDHLVEQTLKIIHKFRSSDIKNRLTYLDLSNRFEIKMTVDSTFDVDLGDMNDIDDKLRTVMVKIENEKQKGTDGGKINIITPTSCSFSKYFYDDADTGTGNAEQEEKEESDSEE